MEKPLAKKNTGSLPDKILEILAVKIFVELHSLNTTLEHPTLGFDLQKQYACGLLKLHQVCIYDMEKAKTCPMIIDKLSPFKGKIILYYCIYILTCYKEAQK